MKERWYTFRKETFGLPKTSIVAVSNTGKTRRLDGSVELTTLRQSIRINNKCYLLSRLIATHFIKKTKEDIKLKRNCVDHISHNPKNININDVRNLRWCTHKENMNFEETRDKRRKSALGKSLSKETRSKISRAVSGKNHPNFGKHYSKELRKKLSESHKGQKVSKKTKNKISKTLKGRASSDFDKKFIEHFGICRCDNLKLYYKEYTAYVKNNKCSWE